MSSTSDDQRNDDDTLADTELEEPSESYAPGEEPKAEKAHDPEPSHEAVGIGVLDSPQADNEGNPDGEGV